MGGARSGWLALAHAASASLSARSERSNWPAAARRRISASISGMIDGRPGGRTCGIVSKSPRSPEPTGPSGLPTGASDQNPGDRQPGARGCRCLEVRPKDLPQLGGDRPPSAAQAQRLLVARRNQLTRAQPGDQVVNERTTYLIAAIEQAVVVSSLLGSAPASDGLATDVHEPPSYLARRRDAGRLVFAPLVRIGERTQSLAERETILVAIGQWRPQLDRPVIGRSHRSSDPDGPRTGIWGRPAPGSRSLPRAGSRQCGRSWRPSSHRTRR
jgi:hypothetical protein